MKKYLPTISKELYKYLIYYFLNITGASSAARNMYWSHYTNSRGFYHRSGSLRPHVSAKLQNAAPTNTHAT